MKRRSTQSRQRRGRVAPSPYTKYEKSPFWYPPREKSPLTRLDVTRMARRTRASTALPFTRTRGS